MESIKDILYRVSWGLFAIGLVMLVIQYFSTTGTPNGIVGRHEFANIGTGIGLIIASFALANLKTKW